MEDTQLDLTPIVLEALISLNNHYGRGYVRSVNVDKGTFWQQPYGMAGYTKRFRVTRNGSKITVKALGHQRTIEVKL